MWLIKNFIGQWRHMVESDWLMKDDVIDMLESDWLMKDAINSHPWIWLDNTWMTANGDSKKIKGSEQKLNNSKQLHGTLLCNKPVLKISKVWQNIKHLEINSKKI